MLQLFFLMRVYQAVVQKMPFGRSPKKIVQGQNILKRVTILVAPLLGNIYFQIVYINGKVSTCCQRSKMGMSIAVTFLASHPGLIR